MLLVTALMSAMMASAETAPEGPVQYFTRTGSFYQIDWEGFSEGTQSGCVGVKIDGNDVYIQNLIMSVNNDSWVKGTLSADGTTITIPQDNVLMETSQWMEMPDGSWDEFKGLIRVSMLTYQASEDGGTFVRDTQTPIELKIEEGTIVLQNTVPMQTVLGAIYDGFEVESLNGKWNIGADFNTVLTPFDEVPVTVPAEAECAEYLMKSIGAYSSEPSYEYVKVYTLGDDVYVKGFYNGNKDLAFKGTRQGDKVHFDGPQFVGVIAGYIMEVVGCKYTKSEPDEWGWSDLSYEDQGAFDLSYDAETGVYTLPQGEAVRLTVRNSCESNWDMLCDLTITPYVEKLLTPEEPIIAGVTDYYDLEGDWCIYFEYSTSSLECEPLNMEHLSYCFYINDELYTFEAERYDLEEDLVEIPFSLEGNQYLNKANYWGVFNYIREQNIWKVGLQLVYRVGDEVSRSTINEYIVSDAPVAICDVKAEAKTSAKRIENGSFVIVKDGVKYNAQGIAQ